MKSNLKTVKEAVERFYVVPTRDNARECKREIEGFENKQKQFVSNGFKRRQWIEDNLFIKDPILQARYAHVLKVYIEKEILG